MGEVYKIIKTDDEGAVLKRLSDNKDFIIRDVFEIHNYFEHTGAFRELRAKDGYVPTEEL